MIHFIELINFVFYAYAQNNERELRKGWRRYLIYIFLAERITERIEMKRSKRGKVRNSESVARSLVWQDNKKRR